MILDTNAVSALVLEDARIIKVLAASERHHLPVIVIGDWRPCGTTRFLCSSCSGGL
jgi:hypothetical protein